MPPPQGGQDSAGSMDFLWLSALFIAAVLLIWHFGKATLLSAIFYLKSAEIYVIALFDSNIQQAKQFADYYSQRPADVDLNQFGAWLTDVGSYINIPVAILLIALAGYLYFKHPETRFNSVFDMKRLLAKEKDNWPQIMPISSLDLINTPVNEGPWAMALAPMEFAKKYKLLKEERLAPQRSVSRNQQQNITVTVIDDKADQVFANQLGPLWQSPDELPIYAQALFAIFAARGLQQRKSALHMLQQISRSAAGGTGHLDFTGVKELLEKNKKNTTIELVANRHAYMMCTMASMLLFARTDGVLATADFLWLKPVDRTLWYMLNSVGRQTPFSEVGGPFAHWLAERSLKRRISQPMVHEATKALTEAVKLIIYVPENTLIDPLDKS